MKTMFTETEISTIVKNVRQLLDIYPEEVETSEAGCFWNNGGVEWRVLADPDFIQ